MTADRWSDASGAFDAAARWFAETAALAEGAWERPGLGEWTVRDLVGHTSRALSTVETYLAKGADEAAVRSPQEYFRAMAVSSGDPASVAQRGRDAGAALGDRPVDTVRELAARVRRTVGAAAGDELVGTPAGGMALAAYLPTRTFELTVHTCDLAAALGLAAVVPGPAAAEAFAIIGALAAEAGDAAPLLRAATGRHGLPAGFSVV